MKAIFAIVAFFSAMSVHAAKADWQYTKWGMSPAQVQTASKGQAKPPAEEKVIERSRLRLTSPYASGEFQFTAEFWFDANDKLESVTLRLNSNNPSQLIGALRQRYGEPENETRGMIRGIRWRSAGDSIALLTTGADTTVNYRPSVNANNRGL